LLFGLFLTSVFQLNVYDITIFEGALYTLSKEIKKYITAEQITLTLDVGLTHQRRLPINLGRKYLLGNELD